MRRASRIVAVLFAAQAGCAGAVQPSAPRSAASDPLFVERERPGAIGSAQLGSQEGRPLALRAEPNREPARQAALAFVRALLGADAVALQRVMAERVAYGVEAATRPRAELIERCIGEARGLRYGPATTAESIVDTAAIEVRRVADEDPQLMRPPGVAASDLIVTLPPHVASAGTTARIPCLHSLYVRLGDPTQVVGLMR